MADPQPREVTHLQINAIWIDCSVRETHGLTGQCTKHPVEDGADITDHVQTYPDQLQLEGIVTNTPLEKPQSHMGADTQNPNAAGGVDYINAAVVPVDETGQPIEQTVQTGTFSVQFEGERIGNVFTVLPIVGDALQILRQTDVIPRKKYNAILPLDERVPAGIAGWAPRFSRDLDRVRAVADALRNTFIARKRIQVVTGLRTYESCIITDLQIDRDATRGASLFFSATCEVIRVVKSQTGLPGAPQPAQTRAKPAINAGPQNTQPVPATEVPAGTKAKSQSTLDNLLRRPPPTP